MTDNTTKEIKNKSEWIIAEGTHPAIISKEVFQAAQKRFEKEYIPSGRRPSSTCKHWLSGVMKCPACGRTMVVSVTKTRTGHSYPYFVCYGYSKGKCAAKTAVSAKKIEPYVLDGIKTATQGELSFAIKETNPVESSPELQILEEQIGKIDIKERRIKEAYMNGIDTMEEYKENKATLAQERKILESKLSFLQKKPVTKRGGHAQAATTHPQCV